MSAGPENEFDSDPARSRFFVIQAVRLAGVACVVLGMLIAARPVGWPAWVGYAMLGGGLVGVFVVPVKLARKWRTPR